MRFLYKGKDGGSESNVTGYWLVEIKSLFSIAILRFGEGSREMQHNHAFNSLSWMLSGLCVEEVVTDTTVEYSYLYPSVSPTYTSRERMHRVVGLSKTSWFITFRGPWSKTWKERDPKSGATTTLTNGRRLVIHD